MLIGAVIFSSGFAFAEGQPGCPDYKPAEQQMPAAGQAPAGQPAAEPAGDSGANAAGSSTATQNLGLSADTAMGYIVPLFPPVVTQDAINQADISKAVTPKVSNREELLLIEEKFMLEKGIKIVEEAAKSDRKEVEEHRKTAQNYRKFAEEARKEAEKAKKERRLPAGYGPEHYEFLAKNEDSLAAEAEKRAEANEKTAKEWAGDVRKKEEALNRINQSDANTATTPSPSRSDRGQEILF